MSLFVSIKKKLGDFVLDAEFENDGSVLGLLGASGCGKSMTLRCIAGIERPDEGKIILNGRTLFDSDKHIDLKPQDRRVGYLFQNYGLFPNMNVEQNILCGTHRIKDRGERKREAKEIIERMMLTGLEKHRPNQLSGGQQQRTALARILISRPEILLLDEPVSAMDTQLKLRLEQEMKECIARFGGDTIFVSHDVDEIYRICNRMAVMDNGRILGVGTVKEMFEKSRDVITARLTGCSNIACAVKTGTFSLWVPEWGVELVSESTVPDDLAAVGIRARHFREDTCENSFPVEVLDTIEEPFDRILRFRFKGSPIDSEPLCMRIAKESLSLGEPAMVGVCSENILLLR